MNKKRNPKRGLLLSALVLLLCASMLVGSTFAWFTDNAATAVNTISSGTLNISLVDAEGNSMEGKPLPFVNENGETLTNVQWEPGATFIAGPVYIKNSGSLAAKVSAKFNGANGDSKLGEVIDWTVTYADDVVVLAGETTDDPIYVSGTMQTTAGNEYQGLTMDSISLAVTATQATVEYDSYNNTYDANAEYDEVVVVASQSELNEAIANAKDPVTIELLKGTYILPSDNTMKNRTITFAGSEGSVINVSSAVAANDSTVTFDGVTVQFGNSNYIGLQHTKKVVYKDCTITGQQFLYAPDVDFTNCTLENTANAYCVWTYGANNVTFTNCTLNTAGKAVLVYNECTDKNFVANVTMTDCTFNDNDSVSTTKGAVETGSNANNTATSNKYNLTFKNCTVNGFAENNEGIATGSTFWGNKNSMDQAHLNVAIDGADVY